MGSICVFLDVSVWSFSATSDSLTPLLPPKHLNLPLPPPPQDMQRPLYMRPRDALEYGIIDEIIEPNAQKVEKAAAYWIKSGRAEGDGRLEQWMEYLSLQEEYALKDSFRKVTAQVRSGGGEGKTD